MCGSLVFASNKSALVFLQKTSASEALSKEFAKPREELLVFIAELIDCLKLRVSEHAAKIKVKRMDRNNNANLFSLFFGQQNCCVSVFRKDKSNRIKNASFKPLMQLVELDIKNLDDILGIRDLVKL